MNVGAVEKKSLTTLRTTDVASAGTGPTPASGSVMVCPGPRSEVEVTPMGP
jgi:hypothetical protein